MTDDIREVMRPTPFGQTRRVRRSLDKEPEPQKEPGEGREEEEAPSPEPAPDGSLDTLQLEVNAANERLAAAKRRVRLRLSKDRNSPLIEIVLPAGDAEGSQSGENPGSGVYGGAAIVTRRISPGEIAAWVVRLETAEGLLIDEKL